MEERKKKESKKENKKEKERKGRYMLLPIQNL